MAQKVSASMFDGEAVTLAFTLTGSDPDISAWVLKFYLFDPADGSQVFSKTLGSGVTITSNVAGNRAWEVTLDRADTTGLSGHYQMEMVRDEAGAETVLSVGPLTIQTSYKF